MTPKMTVLCLLLNLILCVYGNIAFLDHVIKKSTSQGSTENDDEREMNERCKRDLVCTEKDLSGPRICGTNGKTYQNPCELNRIVCFGIPVEMHSMGDCKAEDRCPLEREFQLKLIRSNATKYANEFVPMCDKSTNLYAQVQCHSVIGYCWCSTLHGTPIPSTSVAISTQKMPNCEHVHDIQVDASGHVGHNFSKSSECGAVERIIFNSNMMDAFRREYANAPDEHGDHKGDERNETLERRILVWRFVKLDLDSNDRLTKEELAGEHRLTILVVKPASCARTFHKDCDKNNDKLIDLQEWTTCLKIDLGHNVLPEPNEDNSLPIYEIEPPKQKSEESETAPDFFLNSPSKKSKPEEVQKSTEKPNCKTEKEKITFSTPPNFLEYVFIPRCEGQDERFYSEMQCHLKHGRNVCWCVHPISGEPIGHGLVNSTAECSQTPLVAKIGKMGSIKGNKEMRQSAPAPVNGPKRRRPQVAKWKFAQLDSNGDHEIERSEWKSFRKSLRNLKNVRKCGRNFIRFCDINRDSRINQKEWMTCTIRTYKHLKKTRENPFLTLLHPD